MERTQQQLGGEPEHGAAALNPVLRESGPHESWDERVIREGIDAAVSDGRAIDNRTARYIAGQLHDGQVSALYSLASCGNIDPGVYDELDRGRAEQPEDIRRWIAALSVYCATRADQGPVEGWVEQAESLDRIELFNQITAAGRPLHEIATVGDAEGLTVDDDSDFDDVDDMPWTDSAHWRPEDAVSGDQIEDQLPDTELDELFGGPADEEIGAVEELGWFGLVRQAEVPGGMVLHIDEHGFRRVWRADDDDSLHSRWTAIQTEYEQFHAERAAYEAAIEENDSAPSGLAPRIWVGSLADYNDGNLYGTWFNATCGANELALATRFMLRGSQIADAEEWAVMDYDGFAGIELGEYESFGKISRIAQGIAEHGAAFGRWAAYVGAENEEALERFEDHYLGEWDSFKAYIENYLEETEFYRFLELLPEDMRGYVEVDTEQIARDWGCDYFVAELGDGRVGVFDTRE
jgi:antirestriction protein